MPYSCSVLSKSALVVVLRVEAEQPDCEPYYESFDFALGLLLHGEHSTLGGALGEEAEERLASGALDPSPFVRSVSTRVERKGSLAFDTSPVVRYEIEVTDPRWVAHLAVGDRYASYAWSEGNGPMLDDSVTFEQAVRLAVPDLRAGDRVSHRSQLAMSPGVRHGRGRVVETTTCPRAPAWWEGGRLVHRVELDHGPTQWIFAESLRVPPADTYEQAWAEPDRFFGDLLARSPLERARGLHFLGLRGGGSFIAPPEADRPFEVAIEGVSGWLFGLLRRLPFERAVLTAIVLLGGFQSDLEATGARFARAARGVELAAGQEIEGGHYECCAPTQMVLGSLTMLFAEARVRVPSPLEAGLRRALLAVPPSQFGFSDWSRHTAFALAACDGEPPPIPEWVVRGFESDASPIGLAGAWSPPGASDLHRL